MATPRNAKAQAAFTAHKASIEAMLTRITVKAADHCSVAPEVVDWEHVVLLSDLDDKLADIAAELGCDDAPGGEG